MELKVPFEILEWLDKNRGGKSRQAYIVKCLAKLKEIQDFSQPEKEDKE